MTQLNLTLTPPHSGGLTSRVAAESVRESSATMRAKVLACITLTGDRGATDDEIQRALGMSGNTERPRRRELERTGLIRQSEKTRRTESGRMAVVWVAANGEGKEQNEYRRNETR